MSDVYKIAVKLAVESNAAGVLGAMTSHLMGAQKHVDKLEASLNRLSRIKLAIGGGVAVGAGLEMLKIYDHVAQHGVELLDQQDKLIRAGRTHAEVAALTANAYDRVAKAIPTAAAADILRVTNQLAVVTGDLAAASAAAPTALKIEALLHNITGANAEGAGHTLYRAIEMKGLTSGSETNRALGQKLLETFVQDIAASGGKLTANDYQTMAKRGGAYWKKMTPEFLAGPMSVFAADVGGDTAGTTLATFGQFLTGATQMSKQQFETLSKLDMLDMSKVHKQKNGGFNTDPGAIHGSMDYAGDYFGFMQKVLLPAFEKAGIGEGPVRDSMMAKIGRNRNTTRMMTMFSDPEFVTQISKDMEVFRKALGLDKAYDSLTRSDPKGVHEGFDAQYKSMMEAIGAPMMQSALPVMRGVTALFSEIGAFANANGGAIKALGIGFAGLGAALIGSGTLAILAAIGPAGWLIGGVAALGGAFATFAPERFAQYTAGLKDVFAGLATLDFKRVGAGLVQEFNATFGALAAKVAPAIKSAMDSIAGAFLSAIAGLGHSVASAIAGIFSGIGGPVTTPGGHGLGIAPGAGGGRYHPSAFIPDTARGASVPHGRGMTLALTNVTNVDGRTVATAVTRHQVAAMEFPHAIGGHDSYGSHLTAGATAMPA